MEFIAFIVGCVVLYYAWYKIILPVRRWIAKIKGDDETAEQISQKIQERKDAIYQDILEALDEYEAVYAEALERKAKYPDFDLPEKRDFKINPKKPSSLNILPIISAKLNVQSSIRLDETCREDMERLGFKTLVEYKSYINDKRQRIRKNREDYKKR